MTKYFASIVVTGIFLVIVLMGTDLIAGKTVAGEIISIAAGEYPPWTSEKLKHGGFVHHVITEAFRQEGYRVEYFYYYPWKRNYENAKRGKHHATSYWICSEERQMDFYCSASLVPEETVFFHLKSKSIKDWNMLGDLKDYNIGATIGYTYTKEFWKAAESGRLTVNVVPKDEQNFRMLLKERIDIFPMAKVAGFGLLREKFTPSEIELITFHPKPLIKTTTHLLFPKTLNSSKQLMSIFNQGLRKLKADGLYNKWMEEFLAGKYSQDLENR